MTKPEEKRKARTTQVLDYIRKSTFKGFGCNKERLIAHFGFEWGMARRYVLEYMKMLVIEKKLKEDAGGYWIFGIKPEEITFSD